MKQQKVLLTWESDWADEMDISGFIATSEDLWKNYKEKLKDIEDKFVIYIGTNEMISYDTGEDLLDQITVVKLTDEEYNTLEKTVGLEFGHTEFFQLEDIVFNQYI